MMGVVVRQAFMRERAGFAAMLVGMLAVWALFVPAGAHAQSAGADVSDSPRFWRWSPLSPIGDLGMPTPRLPELPHTLVWPAPRAGAARTSGNPAALSDEIDSSWTQLVFSAGGTSGAYGRPLDPAGVSTFGTSLSGWRRIGERVAAIGRVAVDRENASGGGAAFMSPYGSSPFVPTDTNRPALSRTTVTLEAAEGMALGGWRLGVAVGYRGQENNSPHSAATQIGRSSAAAATIGAERELGARVRAGLYVRGLQSSESVNLIANPQTILVYSLDGYSNADAADYNAALPPFVRRADRSATAWGMDVSGHGSGTVWAAYAEQQASRERQISALLQSNPPTDRWSVTGYAVGGSAQRTIRGWLAALRADWSAQHGDAQRATLTAGNYGADASRLALAVELRHASTASPWIVAATLGLGRDQQAATDAAARITTDIVAWLPSASAEVARRVSDRVAVAVGFARQQYTPFANVPSPARRGTAYTTIIAPEVEVAAATAHADVGSVTARWHTDAGVVSIRGWASNMHAATRPDESVPLPRGSRAAWGLTMSVEPRR